MQIPENNLTAVIMPDELLPSLIKPSRMKLLFVGDNRTGANWGRGASIALDQLLAGSFEINGRVAGHVDSVKMEIGPKTRWSTGRKQILAVRK